MPRLTNNNYLNAHRFLHQLWQDYKSLFILLSPSHQWELHGYYQTDKDLLADHLLTNRRLITKDNPSLPQRAGKHLAKVWKAPRAAEKVTEGHPPDQFGPAVNYIASRRSEQPSGVPSAKGKVGTVRTLARPEIDLDKLAHALLDFTRSLPPEELECLAAEAERDPRTRGIVKDLRKRRAA